MDRAHRRAREGRAGVRRRHACSPATTRARSTRSTPRTGRSGGRPTRRAAGFCAAAASTRPRRWPGGASTWAASTGASTASWRRPASSPGATRPAPRSTRRPRSRTRPHSPPTVYAGSQDKHFYALDARTGEVRWEHPVGGVVLGSSSVVGETVYVSMIGPNIGTFGYDVKKRQEGLRARPGRVQPGDLGRREDLPHRVLDDPRLQAGTSRAREALTKGSRPAAGGEQIADAHGRGRPDSAFDGVRWHVRFGRVTWATGRRRRSRAGCPRDPGSRWSAPRPANSPRDRCSPSWR